MSRWMREVADLRVHGTTAEPPAQRFERDERQVLAPLASRAPFLQVHELTRRVHTDTCIELDINRYSVPWKLISESVTVVVAERQVRVLYAGQEVACDAQNPRWAHHCDRAHTPGWHRRRELRRCELDDQAPGRRLARDLAAGNAYRTAASAGRVREGARRPLVTAAGRRAKAPALEVSGDL